MFYLQITDINKVGNKSIFNFSRLLIPVNLDNQHWVLFQIDIANSIIWFYDSLDSFDTKTPVMRDKDGMYKNTQYYRFTRKMAKSNEEESVDVDLLTPDDWRRLRLSHYINAFRFVVMYLPVQC
jgi:hypothetical protein